MEVIELDFYTCITSHMYFKIFFVLVFGIILAFADEIMLLRRKIVLFIILVILMMIVLTSMDDYGYGVLLLIMLLFILTYNIQTIETKKRNKKNT